MNRLEKVNQVLKDQIRLQRNLQNRIARMYHKVWRRPRQCSECNKPLGARIRDAKMAKKYDSMTEERYARWEYMYQLRKYRRACTMVDEGFPKPPAILR